MTAWSGGSVAAFETPTGVAGLHDIAVLGQPVKYGSGHLGVAKHLRPVGEAEVRGDELNSLGYYLPPEFAQRIEIARKSLSGDGVIFRAKRDPTLKTYSGVRSTTCVLFRWGRTELARVSRTGLKSTIAHAFELDRA